MQTEQTKEQRYIQKEIQQDLEKQLHEQYAINNNAKVSNFVSFIVAYYIH